VVSIAERLKYTRELRKMSVKQLVKAMQLNQKHYDNTRYRDSIKNYEKGKHLPGPDRLKEIADALKIPVEYYYFDAPKDELIKSPEYTAEELYKLFLIERYDKFLLDEVTQIEDKNNNINDVEEKMFTEQIISIYKSILEDKVEIARLQGEISSKKLGIYEYLSFLKTVIKKEPVSFEQTLLADLASLIQ